MSQSAPISRPRHIKRWLYIIHRWIGIFTCLLFAIWFISGLVMIYVPFPSLEPADRLAGLPTINWAKVHVQPAAALKTADIGGAETLSLEMRGTRPVWRITPWSGGETVVSARDGDRLGPAGASEATRIAEMFGRADVHWITRIERDQWTVAGGFDRHRPLWKANLAGPGGRVLYVSSQTGAVVLDTNARERFWNWLGSVPHWIYPTVLRQDNAAWRQVVMWVSGPCIFGAITGMWIGILRTRLRQRRFSHGRSIPYHGWMAWHHIAGLVGGVFLLAWIFSGWLSVDPFRLFASTGVADSGRVAYARQSATPPLNLAALARASAGAKRVECSWVDGRQLIEIESTSGRKVLDATTLAPARIPARELIEAAKRLLPGTPIRSVERLDAPDSYWYGIGEQPVLPVLRVKFADAAGTWVHIDPATGQYLGDLDRKGRIYRWAFDLLHKWDLNVLTRNRPIWDIVLWLLSIVGLVTSVSGIWIGIVRLRHGKAASRLLMKSPPRGAVYPLP
jgi:uncharacterized iron-regulated membrane protein